MINRNEYNGQTVGIFTLKGGSYYPPDGWFHPFILT